ncbi:MAG: FAD-dependent oxidoreductase [Pseudomonadota bacterium]
MNAGPAGRDAVYSPALADDAHIVFIGAGQAAGRCAEALRKLGFAGQITLVGEEAHKPYERPALSKEFLDGSAAQASLALHPDGWYEEQAVELLTDSRVVGVDREARQIVLSDGATRPYDRLVFATGAKPRLLPAAAPAAKDVFYLRSMEDSLRLKERLGPGRRVVVIGGGLIGLEVASTARAAMCDVTVVELDAALMARTVHAVFGAAVAALHISHGVKVLTSSSVTRLEELQACTLLHMADGSAIEADVVVVGIGVQPNTELAQAAGLETHNGLVVDRHGMTNDPAIFGIGDCTSFYHPVYGRHLRLECWKHAQNHAIAVAGSIAGQPQDYADLPYAWSFQHGAHLQFTGLAEAGDHVYWRGDPGQGKAMLCYLRDDVMVAANTINMPKELRIAQKMIEQGTRVDPGLLVDTSVRLDASSLAHV